MKTKLKLLCATTATLLATTAQAALLTLSSPAISAHTGQSAGWGFSLTNDDASYYLLVTGTEFQLPLPSAFGSYTDLLSPRGIALAPGASLIEAFDELLGTGIGQINFAPSADGKVMGSVQLHYALTTVDPFGIDFVDPDTQVVAFDKTVSARASATALPEPGSLALVGLAGLLAMHSRRGRRSIRTKSIA